MAYSRPLQKLKHMKNVSVKWHAGSSEIINGERIGNSTRESNDERAPGEDARETPVPEAS